MTTTKDSLQYDQVSIGQPFELAVASGELPAMYSVKVHGRNPDVGTSIEDVWTQGGVMSWLTTAAVVHAWSSSANDANTTTASGTRTIRVTGLLAGFTATTEDLALNGTATVTSANSWIRINDVEALAVGTYDGTTTPLHGTVNISHGSTITAQLYVDDSITCAIAQTGRFSVPAGYDAYLSKVDISVASGKSANIYMFSRENADDIVAPYSAKKIIGVYDGMVGYNPIQGEWSKFPAKTDIWIAAKAAAVNTSITVEMHLILKAV